MYSVFHKLFCFILREGDRGRSGVRVRDRGSRIIYLHQREGRLLEKKSSDNIS